MDNPMVMPLRDRKSPGYFISLDDIDVSLLPNLVFGRKEHGMPLWPSTSSGQDTEYYEFEVLVGQGGDTDDEDCENASSQRCHVCAIDVPTAFWEEHKASVVHKASSTIAEISLDRTRRQISLVTQTRVARENTYYCPSCSLAVALSKRAAHEASKQHTQSVLYDHLIQQLTDLYEDNKNLDKVVKNIYGEDAKDKLETVKDKAKTVEEKNGSTKTENCEEDSVDIDEKDVIINTQTGAILKVSFDNYHGFHTSGDKMICRVCRTIIDDKMKHVQNAEHAEVTAGSIIKDKNCIRQLNHILNHCILCNEIIENTEAHILCSDQHSAALKLALLEDKKVAVPTHTIHSKEVLSQNLIEEVNFNKDLYYCKICHIYFAKSSLSAHIIKQTHTNCLMSLNENKKKQLRSYEYIQLGRCSICNCSVGSGVKAEKRHNKTVDHRYNLWMSQRDQKIHYHMGKSVFPNKVRCKICFDVNISDNNQVVHEHIKSSEHQNNYKKLLDDNDMKVVSKRFVYCSLCNTNQLVIDEINHTTSKKHKKRLKKHNTSLKKQIHRETTSSSEKFTKTISEYSESLDRNKLGQLLVDKGLARFHDENQNYHCAVCKLDVPKNLALEHLKCEKHIKLTQNINQFQDESNSSGITDEQKLGECNIDVDDKQREATGNSKQTTPVPDETELEHLLLRHNIDNHSARYYHCNICHMFVSKDLLRQHIVSEKHKTYSVKNNTINDSNNKTEKLGKEKQNTIKTTLESTNKFNDDVTENFKGYYKPASPYLNTKNSNKNVDGNVNVEGPLNAKKSEKHIHYLFEVTNLQSGLIRCVICDVYVDFDDIKLHRKSNQHKQLYKNVLDSNTMFRVRHRCFCKCCREIMKVPEEYIHINSELHRHNLNSITERLDKITLNNLAIRMFNEDIAAGSRLKKKQRLAEHTFYEEEDGSDDDDERVEHFSTYLFLTSSKNQSGDSDKPENDISDSSESFVSAVPDIASGESQTSFTAGSNLASEDKQSSFTELRTAVPNTATGSSQEFSTEVKTPASNTSSGGSQYSSTQITTAAPITATGSNQASFTEVITAVSSTASGSSQVCSTKIETAAPITVTGSTQDSFTKTITAFPYIASEDKKSSFTETIKTVSNTATESSQPSFMEIIESLTKETIEEKKHPKENTKESDIADILVQNSAYLIEKTENPKQIICKICQCDIPSRSDLILEHINGVNHTSKFKKILLSNKIQENPEYTTGAGEKYFCTACLASVSSDFFEHINDKRHKSFLLVKSCSEGCSQKNKDDVQTISDDIPRRWRRARRSKKKSLDSAGDQNNAISDIIYKSNERKSYISSLNSIPCAVDRESTCSSNSDNTKWITCEVCNVKLTNNPYHIEMHTIGNKHKANLKLAKEAQMKMNTQKSQSSNFKTTISKQNTVSETKNDVKNGFCKLCQVKVSENARNVQEHVMGTIHLQNLKFNASQNQSQNKSNSAGGITNVGSSKSTSSESQIATKQTSNCIEDGLCTVCNVKVPQTPHNIREHLKGSFHNQNVPLMACIEDGLCKVCNVRVPQSPHNIHEHLKGSSHNQNVQLLTAIKIQQLNNIANTKKNIIASDTVKTTSKNTQNVPMIITNHVVNGFCNVCQVEVPNNVNNIKEHLNGNFHKQNVVSNTNKKLSHNEENIGKMCAKSDTVPLQTKTVNNKAIVECINNVNQAQTVSPKKDVTHDEIVAESKNKHDVEDGFCKVCKVFVSTKPKEIINHLKSAVHNQNKIVSYILLCKNEEPQNNSIISNLNVGASASKPITSDVQNSKDHKTETTIQAERKSFYNCTVCKLNIEDSPQSLSQHFEDKNHTKNIEMLPRKDQAMFFAQELVAALTGMAMQDLTAKQNVVSTSVNTDNKASNDASKTSPSLNVNPDNGYTCDTCNVEVPNNPNDIKGHIEGKKHISNLKKIESDAKMNTNIPPDPLQANVGNDNLQSDNMATILMKSIAKLCDLKNQEFTRNSSHSDVQNFSDNTSGSVNTTTNLINIEEILADNDVKDDYASVSNIKASSSANIGMEIETVTCTNKIDNDDALTNNEALVNIRSNEVDQGGALTTSYSDNKTDNAKTKTDNIASVNIKNNDVNNDIASIITCETDNETEVNTKKNIDDGSSSSSNNIDANDANDALTLTENPGFFICNVCERLIENNRIDIQSHLNSYYHKTKVAEKETKEKEGIILSTEAHFCNICKVNVPKDTFHIKKHNDSPLHATKFGHVLRSNRINMKDCKCYCELCDVYFTKFSVAAHIERANHKSLLNQVV